MQAYFFINKCKRVFGDKCVAGGVMENKHSTVVVFLLLCASV